MIAAIRSIGPVKTIGLVLAGCILLAGVLATPPAPLDRQMQLVLTIFLATVVLWITEPVPYAVSSLLAVILLFGTGTVGTFEEAVSGFASTLVFFLILLFLVGKSVAKVDLDDWVANRLVTATSTPRSSIGRMASAILLLAFLMPSGMARTATFMPIIDQTNDLYRGQEDSPFRRLGYYLIGHTNPLCSMALMTGGGMAIVTAELINARVRPITWVEWGVYMIPPVVLLYLGCVVAATRIYDVEDDVTVEDQASTDGGVVSDDDGAVQALTGQQRLVVGTMLVAIVAWIVGSFVGVPAIIPAMGMVFVFSLPGIGIITAEEFRNIGWGIVFLIGAMLSLLDVMQRTGALDVIIDLLFTGIPVEALGMGVVVVLLAFSILVRGAFSGVSAAIVILLPILLEFASMLGMNRLYTSLGLLIILATVTFHPFNQPTILLAYEAGPLTLREVVLLGVVTFCVGMAVVIVSWTVYWPIADQLVGIL